MEKVRVEIHQDHLERLVRKRKPINALSELLWNALDGDASLINITFGKNPLDGLAEIRIQDNGHGFSLEVAKQSFGELGNSWKKSNRTSPAGRMLHGNMGEGRFSAFTLGNSVTWTSYYFVANTLKGVRVKGSRDDIGVFEVEQIHDDSNTNSPGTEIVIQDVFNSVNSLLHDNDRTKLMEILSVYLTNYSVSIRYHGQTLDPSSLQGLRTEYILNIPNMETIQLVVIEWKHKIEKKQVYYCDVGGFPLLTDLPGVQAPGFDFSAYIVSSEIGKLHRSKILELDDLNPQLTTIKNSVKHQLKEHFRKRAAEKTVDVVTQWQSEDIYPFSTTVPSSPVEQIEREVFDIMALCLNDYLPNFSDFDQRTKKYSLRMLKTLIERSPAEAKNIIQELLDLPKEKLEELAQLLERTTLSSIINASKIVADRLEFINGLEVILFQTESKKKIKERQHLHRLLAQNTWFFGEEYNLSVDDQSLNEVLKKHLKFIGDDRLDLTPVPSLRGERDIVDLMLSRRIPQVRQEEREHLIIELKRPSVKLGSDAATQIENYAFAVANDERFKDLDTRWTFLLVSNDLDEYLRHKTMRQADRPDGLLHRSVNPRISIWVKSWGQLIDACKIRFTFFEERLKYIATYDSGLEYLKKTHSKYLPKDL
jgi:Histidine kinase-, DNA gyrase B-, and HSP90-like ATPase